MHGLGDHPTSPKLFACFLLLARAFVCGGDLLAMFNRGGCEGGLLLVECCCKLLLLY